MRLYVLTAVAGVAAVAMALPASDSEGILERQPMPQGPGGNGEADEGVRYALSTKIMIDLRLTGLYSNTRQQS